MPSERKDGGDQKEDNQPQGREAEGEEYPSGEMGAHDAKKIVGCRGARRLDPEHRVLGMK